MNSLTMDSVLLARLLRGGIENLSRHAEEVNDLNVFPIPDGDTGSNMLMTIQGGGGVALREGETAGSYTRRAADAMLLSARGNSGVILSQFFDGIAAGLEGVVLVEMADMARAFRTGVEHAYAAVMDPVEGTILTVAREASEYAAARAGDELADFFEDFLFQARITLQRTPELLPVLRKAGVVDSGGAGLIFIIEGMKAALTGDETPALDIHISPMPGSELDLDRFNEDSELEFGYCTELLLRLQRAKTDLDMFDVNIIKNYLQTVGDSIVCFRTGSIVKLHVHTKQPCKVLEFCQKYGEYLTVKIENMSLQHNNLPSDSRLVEKQERKKYAVVAAASGEGIQKTLREMGVDAIVEGGQSMNPSADDFIGAFESVNADVVFALPNNGNVILAARQAAKLYEGSDVRVIPTKNIGDCYAALTMLDTESGDTDGIERALNAAMEGVTTAFVSRCVRNAEMDGYLLHDGQYIGFVGKDVMSADNDRMDTAIMLADRLDFAGHEICILIRGRDSDPAESGRIADHIRKSHRGCEVYEIDGGQDVYSYIMIVE